jgi:hypothetical protein
LRALVSKMAEAVVFSLRCQVDSMMMESLKGDGQWLLLRC